MKKKKLAILILTPIVIFAAVLAVEYAHPTNLFATSKASTTAATEKNVLALVNGQAVYESDIAAAVRSGVDRANALDRRITQLVIAEEVEKNFGKEAQIALDAARSDIFGQLFSQKMGERITSEIKDADIADFYTKNIRDEDYRQVKLSVYGSQDAKDAQHFFELVSGKADLQAAKDALAKFMPVKKDGDHFLSLPDVPYNLGQVVKKMKVGDVLSPLVVRDGVLVIRLDEQKSMVKPELAKISGDIRNYLIGERLNKQVQALRKAAKIELKS